MTLAFQLRFGGRPLPRPDMRDTPLFLRLRLSKLLGGVEHVSKSTMEQLLSEPEARSALEDAGIETSGIETFVIMLFENTEHLEGPVEALLSEHRTHARVRVVLELPVGRIGGIS